MSTTAQNELKGRNARMAAPTTAVERLLDPRIPIVTKTDLKGRITYANPAFVEISGFTLEELLGQPHNVVRHPDMPRDAFKDLWDTARRDEPWKGLVKNRCKDGGYYWVDAYVTPLTQNGEKIGYMSVRSKPSDTQKGKPRPCTRQSTPAAPAFHSQSLQKGAHLLLIWQSSVFASNHRPAFHVQHPCPQLWQRCSVICSCGPGVDVVERSC